MTSVARSGRPLISNERGESTLLTPIVCFFRRALGVFPDHTGRSQTILTVWTAIPPSVITEQRVACVHQEERNSRKLAIDPTNPGIVAARIGRLADMDFADLFRMIRDHRKIKRAIEHDATQRSTLFIKGLDSSGMALSKPIGLRRCHTRALRTGILGVRGMNVGISEERPAKGVMSLARKTLFRDTKAGSGSRIDGPIRRLCLGRQRKEANENQRQDRPCGPGNHEIPDQRRRQVIRLVSRTRLDCLVGNENLQQEPKSSPRPSRGEEPGAASEEPQQKTVH